MRVQGFLESPERTEVSGVAVATAGLGAGPVLHPRGLHLELGQVRT